MFGFEDAQAKNAAVKDQDWRSFPEFGLIYISCVLLGGPFL
jgi:hypothetical protein